jgi:hypothetical protein
LSYPTISTGRQVPISAPVCVCVDAGVLGVDTLAFRARRER